MTKRLSFEVKQARKQARDQARQARHLSEAQAIARKNGGECLSTSYVDAKALLLWRCACSHEWEACLNDVKNGRWCPPCGTKRMADGCRGTIQQMQQVAEGRGGKCISKTYVNANSKLSFSCFYKHEFLKTPSKIRQGGWCPKCQGFIGEEICRSYLECLFQSQFPKSRPSWLKKKNGQLELDGYSKLMGIAFEHHGKQHYAKDGFYTKDDKALKKLKERDFCKLTACTENGVKLIIIPELFTLTPITELGNVIQQQCISLGIEIPNLVPFSDFDFSAAYILPYSHDMLKKLQEIAISKDGKCLASLYLGAQISLPFVCSRNHLSYMKPFNVLNDHWCNECTGRVRLDIETMQAFASIQGGRCVSSTYVNSKTPLDWCCRNGTIFTISYNRLKSRKTFCMCQKCMDDNSVKVKSTKSLLYEKNMLMKLRTIAKKRGGKCLSLIYQGPQVSLHFECANGHTSFMRPFNVLNNSWCNQCSGRMRLNIATMHAYAEERGGKCVSSTYVNNKTPLEWCCKNGTLFFLSFSHLRNRKAFCVCSNCMLTT